MSDDTTTYLVMATFILAGITLFGILLSNRRTKESNNLLTTDLKARIRPILARTEIGQGGFEQGVSEHALSDHAIIPEKALFHFTNVGELPAVNIIKTWDIGIKKDEQFIEWKSSDSISKTGIKLPDMAPKEKYSIDIEWDPIHYEMATKSNNCYFRLFLDYEDTEKNSYSYHMEGHFFGGGYIYLDHVKIL